MSKKVISIVLSAAMLIAMLVVGVGAVTASADTVTYYFCAPDAYLATNNDVGVYYWEPSEVAPWPGAPMTAAPEVGYNVYKTEAPDMDATSTIIFNAYVDAGTPADPDLAAVAHQTININVEGYTAKDKNPIYETLDNMYGMIYVLANDEAHQTVSDYSGAITTSGEWFSIDPSSQYYYKKYADYFGTYDFVKDGKDALVTDGDDTDTTPTDGKKWHEGDTVKVALMFGGVDPAGTLTSYIDFDPAYLSYTGEKEKLAGVTGTVLVNDNLSPDDGFEHTLAIGCVFDPTGEEHAFAGEKVALWTFTFKALKDFNEEDLGLSRITTEITTIKDDDVVDVLINDTKDPSVVDNYTELKVEILCDHAPADTDTTDTEDTDSEDTDTTTSSTTSSETSSTTSSETSSTTSSDTTSTTSTTSNTSSKTESKASDDNASKNSSATSSKSASNGGTNNNNNNNNTAATVQTAGTFAVVSLVVILMAAAAVVLYTRKKTEE